MWLLERSLNMAGDRLIWHGPYPLDDSRQIANIPEGAKGRLVILASNGPTDPQHQVHQNDGNIRKRLQAYIDDAKGEAPEFVHGKMAVEFLWAEVTKSAGMP
jgi:hypothetical protein